VLFCQADSRIRLALVVSVYDLAGHGFILPLLGSRRRSPVQSEKDSYKRNYSGKWLPYKGPKGRKAN